MGAPRLAWALASLVLAATAFQSGVAGGAAEAPAAPAAPAKLTMLDMFNELSDVADILNEEYAERRQASALREERCNHMAEALRVQRGGLEAALTEARHRLVAVNNETGVLLDSQRRIQREVNALDERMAAEGQLMRTTETDLVDAKRMRSAAGDHAEANTAELKRTSAVLDQLIGFVRGGVESAPAATLLSLREQLRSSAAHAHGVPGATVLLERLATPGDGTVTGAEYLETLHKLRSLLGEHRTAVSSGEETSAQAHSDLEQALESKVAEIEGRLKELQAKKQAKASELGDVSRRFAALESEGAKASKGIDNMSDRLRETRSRLERHGAECKLLEGNFIAFKRTLLENMKRIAEVKDMLGEHQKRRMELMEDELPQALDQPLPLVK